MNSNSLYKYIEEYKIDLKSVNLDFIKSGFEELVEIELGIKLSRSELKKINEDQVEKLVACKVFGFKNGNEDDHFFDIDVVYIINLKLFEEVELKESEEILDEHIMYLVHPVMREFVNFLGNKINLPNINIPLKAFTDRE